MNRIEKLQAIYDSLPTIECQGKCYESCGPISVSPVERRYVSESGKELQMVDRRKVAQHFTAKHDDDTDGCINCPMLKENRCTIYDTRPLICRLWGIVESMPCIFGCKPSRVISDAEARKLISIVQSL